jgi:TonB family protein
MVLASSMAVCAETEVTSSRAAVSKVVPTYPQILKDRRIGGTVKLQVVISPGGNVTRASLQGGNAILGEAALLAVKKWKFVPADGETTISMEFKFNPDKR